MARTSSLAGQLAVVTGGSSGIGLATAQLLVRQGARVVIVARNQERLKAAASELEVERRKTQHRPIDQSPGVAAFTLDVRDKDAVEGFARDLVSSMGIPRILINCAGITHPGYFSELSYDVFRELMEVDYFGVLNMCRSFVPQMKKQGGHIINVASAAGLYGVFGYTAYSAAKFAVVGFSQALRSELKPYGLRVSVVCPADTDTPQLAFEDRLKPAETRAVAGTTKVLSAAQVARHIVGCLFEDRFLVVPGSEAKLAHLAARLAPGLLERYLDRKIRSAWTGRA